jgi:transcriptional regulator with XRE-family HTH domain
MNIRPHGMHRQTERYGAPLADPVRHITKTLGISQARLARVLGISAPMLSQLMSGQRISLADPTALTRLRALDAACRALPHPIPEAWRERLLGEVAALHWTLPNPPTG